MPVIASVTIPINVKEDHTIELLFLDEVKKCGCIDILSVASALNVPSDELRSTIDKLVGEKAIECTEDTCCTPERYLSFVKRLNTYQEDI